MGRIGVLISLVENDKVIGNFNSTDSILNTILKSLFAKKENLISCQIESDVRNKNNTLTLNKKRLFNYGFIDGYFSYYIDPANPKFQNLMINYIKCEKENELYKTNHFYKIQADFWNVYKNSDIDEIIISIEDK